jgi:hypothetical protein
MKDNTKKLAVVVMIIALAIFMAVAPAWARGQHIQGEYAVVGSAQCAFGPQSIPIDEDSLLPEDGTPLSPSAVTFYNGTFNFSPNGSGSASLNGKGFNSFPPGAPVGGWVQKLEFEFTYTVEDGEITFTTSPGTDTSTTIAGQGPPFPLHVSSGPQKGNISPDGKTLLIHCGAPVIISIQEFGVEGICNISLNGFRQGPYRPSR